MCTERHRSHTLCPQPSLLPIAARLRFASFLECMNTLLEGLEASYPERGGPVTAVA